MFERYKIFIALLLEFTFPHSLKAQVQILFPKETNSKVYFMGEDHRYNKKNNKTSYDLFEYLVKNKGVKNFIYELPISQSFLFNEALRNPSCRKKLWRDITIELSREKKLIELIKNNNLQLFGIDVETDEYSTKESIIYILEQIESKGINIDSLLGTNFKQRIKYDHNIEFKMDIDILDSILKLDSTQYLAIYGK